MRLRRSLFQMFQLTTRHIRSPTASSMPLRTSHAATLDIDPLSADWRRTNPPGGGSVPGLAMPTNPGYGVGLRFQRSQATWLHPPERSGVYCLPLELQVVEQ